MNKKASIFSFLSPPDTTIAAFIADVLGIKYRNLKSNLKRNFLWFPRQQNMSRQTILTDGKKIDNLDDIVLKSLVTYI